MTAAVGPVKAKFNGKLHARRHRCPPNSYRLAFEGSGGAAGFGKGGAQVSLAPEGAGTRLQLRRQCAGRRQARAGRLAADRRRREARWPTISSGASTRRWSVRSVRGPAACGSGRSDGDWQADRGWQARTRFIASFVVAFGLISARMSVAHAVDCGRPCAWALALRLLFAAGIAPRGSPRRRPTTLEAGAAGGRVRGRRHLGRSRAGARGQALPEPRAAGDRGEQARRRHHDRGRFRGEERARRLHDLAAGHHHPRHQREPVREAAVRFAARISRRSRSSRRRH